MNSFELEGFLRGRCLPGDMKVNETNAEYLVRKLSALEQRLIESERYGRQTDITIDNLEMKLAQMAAELSAVEAIHNEAVFITDDHYEQCPPEVQKMIRALAVLKVPAYQAFLAEVRAQGVDMFSEKFGGGTLLSDMVKETAKGFAAQLRKGVQS